ncbi:uncharacterized protein IL334_000830 [Kwoniella shivajii]|uniref:Uncharacterized protein n=1 Tax=Kwoniella shivajii TaxID=564305 RepID=A0ABZ1CRU0_9TREE|nr:hypothetical protein IL334_000830 [Kwoniella shivajii]
MSSTIEDPGDWGIALPAFEGILTKQTRTLLRPFSRFSISSLFRSSTAPLPSISLMSPLLSLAATTPDDHLPSHKEVLKSLEGLKDFATQFKQVVIIRKFNVEDEGILECLAKLIEGYLAGVYVTSRSLWDDPITLGSLEEEAEELKIALKQSLQGFFVVHQILTQRNCPTNEADRHILGSLFPSNLSKFHHLSPLLAHPRQVIAYLQTHTTRPVAQPKFKSPIQISMTSAFPELVSDNEFLYVMSLLDILSSGIEKVEILNGPAISKNDRGMEDDCGRPLRVNMEIKILKCDLLLSVTTKKIGEVKKRALAKLEGVTHESEVESRGNDNASAGGKGTKGDQDDVKPDLIIIHDLSSIASTNQTGRVESDIPEEAQGVAWEMITEDSLVDCLQSAKNIIEQGQIDVLKSHIEASDWLGDEGVFYFKGQAENRKAKSPSLDPTERSDSESEFDFESDTEVDSLNGQDGSAHPCPLRTIFRLHDRYEEQRLAIWLNLPSSERCKMGWFMRGEDGKVGSTWDAFGLAVMMEYDTVTLLNHGLEADKLDKWVELASVKNTKRIKKRGRKMT